MHFGEEPLTEIVEDIDEYMAGSPMAPTEPFLKKGRLPPKRGSAGSPEKEGSCDGACKNRSPGAVAAVVPDFQTEHRAIRVDAQEVDEDMMSGALACSARLRRTRKEDSSDLMEDQYDLDGFAVHSPVMSPELPNRLSLGVALPTYNVTNSARNKSAGPSTSVAPSSARCSYSSANPSPAASPQQTVSLIVDPVSQQNLSCPLPMVDSSRRGSPSSAISLPVQSQQSAVTQAGHYRRGSEGGRSNDERRASAASQPTLPTVPMPSNRRGSSQAPPVTSRAPSRSSAAAVAAPFSFADRSDADDDASESGQHCSLLSPPDPRKQTVVMRRRSSLADWTSGYGMPRGSFLKPTGSAVRPGNAGAAKTAPTATKTHPSAAATTVASNVSTTRPATNSMPPPALRTASHPPAEPATMRKPSESIADRMKFFESTSVPASVAIGLRPAASQRQNTSGTATATQAKPSPSATARPAHAAACKASPRLPNANRARSDAPAMAWASSTVHVPEHATKAAIPRSHPGGVKRPVAAPSAPDVAATTATATPHPPSEEQARPVAPRRSIVLTPAQSSTSKTTTNASAATSPTPPSMSASSPLPASASTATPAATNGAPRSAWPQRPSCTLGSNGASPSPVVNGRAAPSSPVPAAAHLSTTTVAAAAEGGADEDGADPSEAHLAACGGKGRRRPSCKSKQKSRIPSVTEM